MTTRSGGGPGTGLRDAPWRIWRLGKLRMLGGMFRTNDACFGGTLPCRYHYRSEDLDLRTVRFANLGGSGGLADLGGCARLADAGSPAMDLLAGSAGLASRQRWTWLTCMA